MRSLLFVLFVFVSLTGLSTGPDSTAIAEIIAWQTEMNEHYMDKEHSPLEKKDRRKFTGHSFFKIDLNYRVKATIELTPKSDTFGMTTNTDRRPLYRQYGIAHFNISGVAYKLSIFQNIKYAQIEGHENSLFLLFNDLTNGTETYGGGRYIDLEIGAGNEILIDFNKAYNPYCHYNSRYSCPIPPSENYLPVAIKAGVKAFKSAISH